MKRRAVRLASVVAVVVAVTSGCSLESLSESSGVVNVVVGYQSKTINTVTAGTLLRAQGYLEHRLADITTRTGTKYAVRWKDYDTGAPITAQMLAEKIDIGSMGDYPMLINGSPGLGRGRIIGRVDGTERAWRDSSVLPGLGFWRFSALDARSTPRAHTRKANSAQGPGVEQAVLRFGPQGGVDGVAGQPALQLEPGSPQHSD